MEQRAERSALEHSAPRRAEPVVVAPAGIEAAPMDDSALPAARPEASWPARSDSPDVPERSTAPQLAEALQ